jgi:c-di-GMP-binding flagellar brake protein YcgR
MPQVSNARDARLLVIGQRLEVGYALRGSTARTDDSDLHWIASRLEDIDESSKRLTVAWPTDATRQLIEVDPGDTLQVAASTSDALYAATVLIEETLPDAVPMLIVRVSGSWRRLQRRNAVRVSVAIRPRVADKLIGEAYKSLRLGITNLSAAGVQVRSQDELNQGDLIVLAFNLMGVEEELLVQARVKRVMRYDRGLPAYSIWDAGCCFEGLPKRFEQRIVQYVFAQQRALARARGAQL